MEEWTHPACQGARCPLGELNSVERLVRLRPQERWHPSACTCPPGDAAEAERQKAEGNDFYRRGELTEAFDSYSRAIESCPWAPASDVPRAIYHCNRAAVLCDMKEDAKAVLDCNESIRFHPTYAKANERLDKLEEALSDYRQVLVLDPSQRELRPKVDTLDREVRARTERLKTEMMGKLKDLGNSILGKFGLSLDNFKLQQDPGSGSYNIQFQK